jgi:cysteine desulfurase/selenocysteine lyase
MIHSVGLRESSYAEVPNKFEAGTPSIAEGIALGVAVDYLQQLGMAAVRQHERELVSYALARLHEVPGLQIYGPGPDERGGVISFNLGEIHPHDVATILDRHGIAIRAGHHCTQPLMQRLDVPATVRASFYVYNLPTEVDRLVDGLLAVQRIFAG